MSEGGGGGGCNILGIFCNKRRKEIAVFDMEDKAAMEAATNGGGLGSQGCNSIDIFNLGLVWGRFLGQLLGLQHVVFE